MKRKIWHLSSNRWNSAITEYALSAARALAAAGEDCLFLPLQGSPAEVRSRRYLPTHPLQRFDLRAVPEVWALAGKHRPDVVMTYGGPETVLARAISGACGAKIVRFRGYAVDLDAPLASLRHRFAHRHVRLVLTPSEALATSLRRFGPLPPAACVVLGCDTSVFAPRSSTADRAERPEIVLLGRLDPVKGHAAILAILAPLLRAKTATLQPRPRLHIVGEPANLSVAQVESLIRAQDLVLGEDVLITARRIEDVAQLMSNAALAVVPSLGSEFICRTAEEFLLCGTPVAVSGVGSLGEVLFPGAGFSYLGLSPEAVRSQFAAWLERRQHEGAKERKERALAAAARFSLAAMGRSLQERLAAI